MIERVRLTAGARSQLSALKRKTGIAHNNAICRHALCVSLANPSRIPNEKLDFTNGLEIDWRTFTGGYESLYYNLLVTRLMQDGGPINADSILSALILHVHRGLSYLSSKRDADLSLELARSLVVTAKVT